jgi:hypothetical protein
MKIGAYNTHPAADTVRLMTGVEFDSLVESIRLEGQRQRIVLWVDPTTGEELVLDGRNRLRACLAAGVEPQCAVYGGDDPWLFVANSRLRQSMTAAERAYMAAEMLDHLQAESGRKGAAVEVASELCGVSESYVTRADGVRLAVEQGNALVELYDMLRDGEAGLSEVRELAAMPLAEQEAALEAVKSGQHESLRDAVVARREPEPADTKRFTASLKAWVEKQTKTWTAAEKAGVAALVRGVADAV